MGRPDGKWARLDGLLKTWRNEFIYVGRPDGNNGCSDGARAKPLSPFFSRGTFGRTCRRGFRRGSRAFSGRNCERACIRASQEIINFATFISRPDGYESRSDACTSLALFFPFCSRTLANTSN
jgi:hypothetical protein